MVNLPLVVIRIENNKIVSVESDARIFYVFVQDGEEVFVSTILDPKEDLKNSVMGLKFSDSS